jgi:hypothetical protein
MRNCNKNLTSLQRRSISLVGSSLGICAALSLSLHEVPLHHFTAATYGGIALMGAFPIIMTVVVIAQYLSRETDEYLRGLVVKSILWGFGVLMIVDTLLGYLVAFATMDSIHLRSLGVFNLEVFIVTAAIAFRIRLRSDQ